MVLFGLFTDSCTLGFTLYHAYIYFKHRKSRENRQRGVCAHSDADSSIYSPSENYSTRSNEQAFLRNYPYIFILMSLILGFEQLFEFVKFFPFYSLIKLILVLVICVPGTKMANRLYKEYIVTFFDKYETQIDNKLLQFKAYIGHFFISAFTSAFNVIRDNEDKISQRFIKLNAIKPSPQTKACKEE